MDKSAFSVAILRDEGDPYHGYPRAMDDTDAWVAISGDGKRALG
jgi:hypothetical protein